MAEEKPKAFQDLKIVALLDGLMNTRVEVGILAEEGAQLVDHGDATLAQIAHWNEYGTMRIPARPAFRQFMAGDFSAQAGSQLTEDLKAADTPEGCELALARFGERMAEGLWQAIDHFMIPPNAESTVKKKGFNKPLIESGHMRDSVAWELSKNGSRIRKEFARK